MAATDNAQALRDRAYQIWEAEGRPSGREHEHWAQAARELEQSAAPQPASMTQARPEREDQEVQRLRRALYEPAEFSVEPFRDMLEAAVAAVSPARIKAPSPSQHRVRLAALMKRRDGIASEANPAPGVPPTALGASPEERA